MKFRKIFYGLILVLISAVANAATLSPVGYWAARDDDSGKVLSIIQIWKDQNGTYNGRIYKIMNVMVNGIPQKPTDKCKECSGNLANKPMLCMQIIYNLKPDQSYPNTWSDGKAYDPKSDNTYHAKMWLDSNNKTLNLRGYIMMPLFGRTQKWTRVSKPAPSAWVCKRSVANSYHL
jgi:uncharacterized protein (DUF2147 family)